MEVQCELRACFTLKLQTLCFVLFAMALNNHICVLQGEAISVHCVSMIMRFSRLVTASFWFFCHSGFSYVTSHTVFHILYKHHCVERYDEVILS